MVVLWTDALIFLLLAVMTVFAVSVLRDANQRSKWRQVLRRPTAFSALFVLFLFGVVGISDSLHFRNDQGRVLSVFDVAVEPLWQNDEKTYSAPLAAYSFSKETQAAGQGSGSARDYPRLAFGGAHLDNPARDHLGDISARIGLGLVWGLLAVGGVLLLLGLGLFAQAKPAGLGAAFQRFANGETVLPWRSFMVTFAVIALMTGVVIELAGGYHVLGTDKVGQDTLYLTLKSIRTGLVIGTLTTLIMLPFAILFGLTAGYFRGWVDDVIQYVYTTLNSIPGVLLIAAAILMLQVYMANNPDIFDSVEVRSDARLLALCAILGVMSWTGLARLLRAETLKLRELDYVEAAMAFGVSDRKILIRHILPNVMHLVLITVVLEFSSLVLAEAVLSYVGIGVDPLMNSWGNMINAARLEMAREPMVWWPLMAAFSFMFALVLAANLFADAVRDAFDPRTSSSR